MTRERVAMGVMGTYCMICGVAVQHDHYVDTDRPNVYEIYRNKPYNTRSAFDFGPEHEWLKRGVALPEQPEDPEPVKGEIEDGALNGDDDEPYFVMDGVDDYGAVHEACWELAGRPAGYENLRHLRWLHGVTLLTQYQEQLFDFPGVERDHKTWLLADPAARQMEGGRNRARIQALLKEGERVAPLAYGDPSSAQQILLSNSWNYATKGEAGDLNFFRYRQDVKRGINPEGFTEAFWVRLPFTRGPKGLPEGLTLRGLERYETELIDKLQGPGLGVVLACFSRNGKMHYITYVSQLEPAEEVLRGIERPPNTEETIVDHEHDPEWKVLFQKIFLGPPE